MTTGTPVASPVRGNSHAGFGGGPRKRSGRKAATAPRADPTSRPTRSMTSVARSGTQGGPGPARPPAEDARYALWKNPEHLTDRQRVKLA